MEKMRAKKKAEEEAGSSDDDDPRSTRDLELDIPEE